MSSEVATIVACIGALVGLAGWGVALYNARKAVSWKRAELASSYLKERTSNQVLVFACRALEWNGGRLVVPDVLRPLMPDRCDCIDHDPSVLDGAMSPTLTLVDMSIDPRFQLYRTAIDDLLSWMDLMANALNRKLFLPEDVPSVGYWTFQIEKIGTLKQFIDAFGYRKSFDELAGHFAHMREDHRDGRALSVIYVGFGGSANGRSSGG